MKHEQIKNVNILQLDKKTNQILLSLSGATHLVYIERKFKVSAYREITNREDSEFPSSAQVSPSSLQFNHSEYDQEYWMKP